MVPLVVGIVGVLAAALLLWSTWELIVDAIVTVVAFALAIVFVVLNTVLVAKLAWWLIRR